MQEDPRPHPLTDPDQNPKALAGVVDGYIAEFQLHGRVPSEEDVQPFHGTAYSYLYVVAYNHLRAFGPTDAEEAALAVAKRIYCRAIMLGPYLERWICGPAQPARFSSFLHLCATRAANTEATGLAKARKRSERSLDEEKGSYSRQAEGGDKGTRLELPGYGMSPEQQLIWSELSQDDRDLIDGSVTLQQAALKRNIAISTMSKLRKKLRIEMKKAMGL